MKNSIYTINDIQSIVAPIAARHGVEGVFLFCSYARGNPSKESDIDLRIDKGTLKGMFAFGALYSDLEAHLRKEIDHLTTGGLDSKFLHGIKNDEVLLYDRSRIRPTDTGKFTTF